MDILTKQILQSDNVVSLRQTISLDELKEKFDEIRSFVDGDNIILSVYSMNIICTEYVLDIELIIPVDLSKNIPEDYGSIHNFSLNNALKAEHNGSVHTSGHTVKGMLDYISDKKLLRASPIYRVCPLDIDSEKSTVIYIGVAERII